MSGFNRRAWRMKPPPGTPLIAEGHAPNKLAFPFNEGAGRFAFNYAHVQRGVVAPPYGTLNPAVSTSTGWSQGKNGPRLSCNGGDAGIFACDVLDLAVAASLTVIMGQRRRGGVTNSSAFGGNSSIIEALVPYGDGTVYFDFVNKTTGRISIAGLTFGDDIWAFTVGPRGQEIWQNGQLVQSQGTSLLYTGGANNFIIGGGADPGVVSDNADIDFFYLWNVQIPIPLIQALTVSPFSVFEPHRTRVFGVTGSVAPGVFTPYVDVMPPFLAQ